MYSGGKPTAAVKYLKMVQEIEQEMTCMDDSDRDKELASTYVNICSIYSGMGK